MKFKIFNEDGIHIPNNQLDIEACEIWNKNVNSEYYAFPGNVPDNHEDSVSNWFDRLTYYLSKTKANWDLIIDLLIQPLKDQFTEKELNWLINDFPPIAGYIELFKQWKSKNYQIKIIK